MYFNIKCIGKLLGPTNEFERSMVFETGEFERPKFDCTSIFSSGGPFYSAKQNCIFGRGHEEHFCEIILN